MISTDRPRILVVDDQAGPRESLRILLGDRYEVLTASSGEEGLQRAAAAHPDLVFMDIRMPGLNGVEVLQRLKALDPTVEVVMITAYASLETVKNALRFGALDYLVKPFSRRDVEEAVQRAVTRRREQQEANQLAKLVGELRTFARGPVEPSPHEDLAKTLAKIVNETTISLESTGMALFLTEGSVSRCLVATGLPHGYQERIRFSWSEAEFGQAPDRILFVSRAGEPPFSDLLEGSGYPHAALFFLSADGMTTGLLAVYYGPGRVLLPREVSLLRGLAAMAAVAIRNTQLRDTSQREAAGHALRAVQLGILREIDRAVAAQLDRDALVAAVTGQLERGLGYDRVTILHRPENGEILDRPDRVVCPINTPAEADWMLVAENHRSGRPITEPEREILRMCAEHVAIALRNAQLYEEIKTAKGRFETLIESAGEAIVAVGSDGRIHSWNPKAMQLFLYEGEEILGHPIERLLPGESYRLGVERLREAGRPQTFETRAQRKDGTGVDVGVTLSAIEGPGGDLFGILALIRDVTEQKLLGEQLIQSEKLTALGQLAGGIAHDFNNLLQAIIGYTQLAARHFNNPEAVQRWLGVIEIAAKDGSDTVRRIQEFSRTRPDAELVPVNLNAAIRAVLTIVRPRWNEKTVRQGVEVIPRLDLGTIPPILGRPAEIREVFTNLVLNALDAMPSGGEIRIRTWAEGDAVLVSVADSGVGMSEEVRRRVFDPFFTTKGELGTGLGLSVTYSIVTRHGGKIWVDSREEAGTVFTMRFPAYREEAATPQERRPVPRGRPGRILVIEDEERVKEILADMLKEAGHVARGTGSGAEGLRLLGEEPFDLLITDLGMPRMSGWEVIQQVRARDRQLPIVVVTGWGLKGEEERHRLRELGVNRCLFKPVRIQELLQAVNEILAN